MEAGRRLFVHVGGYDPTTPEAACRRFGREYARFLATWSFRGSIGAPDISADRVTWTIDTAGPGWSAATEYWFLRWDDVMAAEASRSRAARLVSGLATFGDFVVSGALTGYLRHAWRYALFFLYPFVLIGLIAASGALVGRVVAAASGSGLVGIALGVPVGVGLLWWGGRALMLDHLLDDWNFSRRFLRAGDPTLDARLDRTAVALDEAAASGQYAEIVVLGHSLGAVLAVHLVDRLRAVRGGGGHAASTPVALVTVGSSLPKLGLHRAARALRAAIGRVAATPELRWVEFQVLTDPMNFYKTDPVAMMRTGGRAPLVRIVKFHRMLRPEYLKRIRGNFFRLHNQFVSANDLRYFYDFTMLAAGPIPAARLLVAPEGAVGAFGPDGSLLATGDDPPREIAQP